MRFFTRVKRLSGSDDESTRARRATDQSGEGCTSATETAACRELRTPFSRRYRRWRRAAIPTATFNRIDQSTSLLVFCARARALLTSSRRNPMLAMSSVVNGNRCILFLAILLSSSYVCCQYRAKTTQGTSLSDRVQQLSELALTRPVIKFNGAKFKEYVKTAPRNYSVVVMFTAMAPQRQCQICRHASDEFVIVANSFRYLQSHSKRLFFASVDFDEGSDVFQMMRLNTAPVYVHFPPKGKPKGADTMDIQRVGFGAEAIAKWISERTDVQIRVFRPPNYSGTVAIIMLLVLIGGFLYLRRNNLDFIYNKTIWGLAALFFTFIMTSGQMWNHIRGPPFIHRSPSGNVAYVHASSQGQYILETYIVMVLNGAVVLGMILMTEAAARKGDVKKRRIFAAVGAGLVAVFFSLLLSIFRNKAQGYPYSLLFK